MARKPSADWVAFLVFSPLSNVHFRPFHLSITEPFATINYKQDHNDFELLSCPLQDKVASQENKSIRGSC